MLIRLISHQIAKSVLATMRFRTRFMSKAVVPHLVEGGGGVIVNNASMVAHIGSATAQIAYCAAKGGVVSMSREMVVELAPANVRVNAIRPGPLPRSSFTTPSERHPATWSAAYPTCPSSASTGPTRLHPWPASC